MNEAEKLGQQIGARIKALKEAASNATEKGETGKDAPPAPTINVAAPAVTVNVPEAAPPTINVEPVIQVSAEMPAGEPPVIHIAAPDMAPVEALLRLLVDAVHTLQSTNGILAGAITDLAKAQSAEKRLIIEDGKPVGVRAVGPSVH